MKVGDYIQITDKVFFNTYKKKVKNDSIFKVVQIDTGIILETGMIVTEKDIKTVFTKAEFPEFYL